MNNFLKHYGATLLLLAGVIAGGVCGVVSADAAHAVKPVGDFFLNLVFVTIVPLVFFSISTAICKMRSSGSLGRTMLYVMAVFAGMTLVAALIAYFSTLIYDPLGNVDRSQILGDLSHDAQASSGGIADAIVRSLSVPDFSMLLSKSNLLPLILFSALLGYATSLAGEKGRSMAAFLESGSEVTMKMMGILMYLAPVGLGCYFADTIATVGSSLLGGYLRTFVLFTVLTLTVYFGLNSLYVFMARGAAGLRSYWKYIVTPSVTAIATSSSAATMPASIMAAKSMGVKDEIAETVIPLGTNIHKDGSMMLGVFKVVFLMLLFSRDIATPGAAVTIICLAVLSSIVLGAIPGGGFTGEVLICTLLGLSPELTGVIVVIATIADIHATLLNATSNVVGAILVDRISERRS